MFKQEPGRVDDTSCPHSISAFFIVGPTLARLAGQFLDKFCEYDVACQGMTRAPAAGALV